MSFVRDFYRFNGETPSHEQFLKHLKSNKLYSGEWNDLESDREVRSARVLDFVLQTFDPTKLGKGQGKWNELPRLNWIRQYARQHYGSTTGSIVKSTKEVEITEDGEIIGGQRIQRCSVSAAFVRHCVWVILTCMEDLAENDGLPESRIVKVWDMLPNAPSWNRDHYVVVRQLLEDRGVVDIYDKKHKSSKCWRWRKANNYPLSPEDLKEKLDYIKSVRFGIGFLKPKNLSPTSMITPYCKSKLFYPLQVREAWVEQRPPPVLSR